VNEKRKLEKGRKEKRQQFGFLLVQSGHVHTNQAGEGIHAKTGGGTDVEGNTESTGSNAPKANLGDRCKKKDSILGRGEAAPRCAEYEGKRDP